MNPARHRLSGPTATAGRPCSCRRPHGPDAAAPARPGRRDTAEPGAVFRPAAAGSRRCPLPGVSRRGATEAAVRRGGG